MPHIVRLAFLLALLLLKAGPFGLTPSLTAHDKSEKAKVDVLAPQNFVAWCIVPFDAAKRTPAERAQMLKDLGIHRCAYDWRAEHVPTFEEEIQQYQKQGIEFFAFWDLHDEAFRLFEKYDLHPQIWRTLVSPPGETQEARVEAAVAAMRPAAQQARQQKCPFGLYNHGGWGGEPANLVAVCEKLRAEGLDNVGIVYNFHHGHDHIADFAKSFRAMLPHLFCVNLNGMNDRAEPKILGIGKGQHELAMIRTVIESGYQGPIGIIDHRPELDARESLQENLDGLAWVRKELREPGSGGPSPREKAAKNAPTDRPAPAAGQSESMGHLLPGKDDYRQFPLTVECRVRLTGSDSYNILVASDTKASSTHWELFTMPQSGYLTAYLPGYQPGHVRSTVSLVDGNWHHVAMTVSGSQARLFVDGTAVAEAMIARQRKDTIPGDLGIGRLVEGQLACQGDIAEVWISHGLRDITPQKLSPPGGYKSLLGHWEFPTAEPAAAKTPMQPHAGHHQHSSAAGAIPMAAMSYDPDFARQLASEAANQGDGLRGATLFAAAKSACLSCHRVGTLGGTVGPELLQSLKDRESVHLVESLFWPKRDVKPEFVVWTAITTQGQVSTGYLVEKTAEGITLRDPATGTVRQFANNDLDELLPGSTLMPEGLMASLSRQQQRDLVRFLQELREAQPERFAEFQRLLKQGQSHQPATFAYQREPLVATDWPLASHPVNRDRIYDFYTKEAEHFRTAATTPHLLPAFPGLDGGAQGHWGNQNEQVWADDRWNQVQLGSVQAGVFRGNGVTVPRGICLQLGEQKEFAACFNPETLNYEAIWSGGFVKFSAVRHGFMHGLEMVGTPLPPPEKRETKAGMRYQGFYRQGNRVVFAYRVGEIDYLDAPWVENGQFVREVAPVGEHTLRAVIQGSPAQWPQKLETAIVPGQGHPYAVDTIELPVQNPWNTLLFCGGHDFLSDGTAVVCTMHGDVWRVTGLDSDPTRPGTAQWRRFASGLHQPLGLVVADDQIYVQCRDQLLRLHDLNDDHEADFYECVSQAFQTSPAGHDFICGLERDAQGRFYTASGNQGLIRLSADGQSVEVLATGFRNPDGLGLTPGGLVTVPVSEGEWTPASMICALQIGTVSSHQHHVGDSSAIPHFGYGGPKKGQPPALPLAYLPRGLDNSSGGQVFIDSDRWGPVQGQMVHLSFGQGAHFLLLKDEVAGQFQGAIVPLVGDFRSGVHRGRFRQKDGQLYVCGMAGWGSYTPDDGCFQRVRYTGESAQLPTGFHVYENGVAVTFSEPLETDTAQAVSSHFAQCWNYRYSAAYGSPEYAPSHPGVRGHDAVTISSAHVLPDRKTLFLEIPGLQPTNQLHLRLHVNTGKGNDLFVTIHRLDEDFVDFPGYQPREKTIAAHPLLVDLATNAIQQPNPWRKPIPGARPLEIQTGTNLTYATRELRVKRGEPLQFTLVNPDVVPHNWALIRPGSLSAVGALANQLIADPEAVARQYIPRSDDVLVYTDVVPPAEKASISFNAPQEPGHYPYLCTFPGHWMVMNGTLIVE